MVDLFGWNGGMSEIAAVLLIAGALIIGVITQFIGDVRVYHWAVVTVAALVGGSLGSRGLRHAEHMGARLLRACTSCRRSSVASSSVWSQTGCCDSRSRAAATGTIHRPSDSAASALSTGGGRPPPPVTLVSRVTSMRLTPHGLDQAARMRVSSGSRRSASTGPRGRRRCGAVGPHGRMRGTDDPIPRRNVQADCTHANRLRRGGRKLAKAAGARRRQAMSARPASAADVARCRYNLQGEVDGAHIYRAMAANAGDPQLATSMRTWPTPKSATPTCGADAWRQRPSAPVSPSWRARALAFVARRGGAGWWRRPWPASERESRTMYDDQPEASGTTLPADSNDPHARTLHRITGGLSGAMLTRFEGRHQHARRQRAAGRRARCQRRPRLQPQPRDGRRRREQRGRADRDRRVRRTAGRRPCSMALGEWLSARSSRELVRNTRSRSKRRRAGCFPEEEEEELAARLRGEGFIHPERGAWPTGS